MNKIEILKLNNEKENKVYSPYSLLVALSMLNEGADGHTKDEINNILSGEQITILNNIENVLSILNRMYIRKQDNNLIKEDYKNVINYKYNADVILDSLTNVDLINQYIEQSTFGQIKNMLNSITGNSLLINTIAVDMEWPYEISSETVRMGSFLDVQASYIYGFRSRNASYYKDDEVTTLGLELKQYDSNRYECVLIQPDNMELDNFIENIEDNKLNNILNNLKELKDDPRDIFITVPKFSFNYELNADKIFKTLGFDMDHPNLSKISDINDGINIHHKSNIDFSENGLKAASATVVEMRCGCAYREPQEKLYINIDKPFLFVLREKNTNSILFLGTVYNPILWENDKQNYQKGMY